MKLELKAKHFEGTEYCIGKCAIEKAYFEETSNECTEGVDLLLDIKSRKNYLHDDYSNEKFNQDKLKAQSHNWDDTVIRTIELREV